MRVLFAVSNEKMSETIVNQYQKEFKEIKLELWRHKYSMKLNYLSGGQMIDEK